MTGWPLVTVTAPSMTAPLAMAMLPATMSARMTAVAPTSSLFSTTSLPVIRPATTAACAWISPSHCARSRTCAGYRPTRPSPRPRRRPPAARGLQIPGHPAAFRDERRRITDLVDQPPLEDVAHPVLRDGRRRSHHTNDPDLRCRPWSHSGQERGRRRSCRAGWSLPPAAAASSRTGTPRRAAGHQRGLCALSRAASRQRAGQAGAARIAQLAEERDWQRTPTPSRLLRPTGIPGAAPGRQVGRNGAHPHRGRSRSAPRRASPAAPGKSAPASAGRVGVQRPAAGHRCRREPPAHRVQRRLPIRPTCHARGGRSRGASRAPPAEETRRPHRARLHRLKCRRTTAGAARCVRQPGQRRREWQRLQGRFGAQLGGLAPRIVVASTATRATLPPAGARRTGRRRHARICDSLKGQSQACVPVLPR